MENKDMFWQNHDANTGATAIGKKVCLGMKQCWSVKK